MTPVVYVHGLWMPGDESLVLRHRLSQEFALSLHSFRYSAAFASIQSTTERLAAFVSDLKAPAVHFVGHSLGGLIIHRFLEGFGSHPPGRVVFLGTPASGSRAAEQASRFAPVAHLMGSTVAEELLKPQGRRWNHDRELGIVAGTQPLGVGQLLANFSEDNDGTVACLCDLATTESYHATVSNPWSIGIEMYQETGNGIHEAVLDSAVKLVPALCRIFGIQFQIPRAAYKNQPLRRMTTGGEHCVGVFGHRDNTDRRGHGDPGDEIFKRLAAAGAEQFDHDAEEDLAAWKSRQNELVAAGANLEVDGVPGPATRDALKCPQRPDGIWALG